MDQYVGLDVSQSKTAVCVIDGDGRKQWEGECSSTPEAMEALLRKRAPTARKIALETGPLCVWHWHAMRAAGLPVVCIHARHARAALSVQINKTDANDAHGLAQLVRSGWYREVEVKSLDTHKIRLLLSVRKQLVGVRTKLYSQIRGLLKTFGVVLPAGKGATFERLVAEADIDHHVRVAVDSLLLTWKTISSELKKLNREIDAAAAASDVCQRLMSIPGVGPVTALAYVTTIDNPARFRRSKDVGPYLGLTPMRYQSGEVDRAGHISKCGDRMTRSLLFEAAGVLLSRCRSTSALQSWGRQVARRSGYSKARVAVARKLAVIMHRMWIDGAEFVARAA